MTTRKMPFYRGGRSAGIWVDLDRWWTVVLV